MPSAGRCVTEAPRRAYDFGPDGVRLAVRLTPRAGRNGLDGIVMGADGRVALQLRVSAPPVDGAANTALVAYLAEILNLRKSDIRLVSGATSRQKLLALRGDADAIVASLDAWVAGAATRR